ncbi:MAG TPA: MAPEG family protein [Burkholderiales bacterium]|nr:MAPEG family protein [Burkholderiales bacterium]
MSIPVWVLLGFAGWTLVTLLGSDGVYRWSQILTKRATMSEWRADLPQGSEWYQRAMRAHANCVENLAVYAAIVVAIVATGVQNPVLDTLAIVLIFARVFQTLVHISLKPTNLAAAIRFAFFFVQLICMFSMGMFVAVHA